MTIKKLLRKKSVIIPFGIITLIILLHPFLLTLTGTLLIKSDQLKRSDVIIVLAGEHGERVKFGSQLYKEGYADTMLLSGGEIVNFPGSKIITWAGLMKEYAMRLGVPENSILLQKKSRNTYEDALFSYQILENSLPDSVILVTSPYHSKRAASLFKKVFNHVEIYSVPVVNSWFNPNSWWKSMEGRHQVLREYFAILLCFLEGSHK